MDTTETSNHGRNITLFAEMKTDLNLLLECLKFQMGNPDSQKETLVAIRSICQDNSDACDYFRQIGGLIFLNNLSTSSTHSILKGASLYTLAVLAESNVYCQQTLCTSALFEDINTILSDEQSSINLKRMCVYVFLVLVSNNKTGQSLARESGCIDILLLLFSKTLTCNIDLARGNTNPQYQLWSSVCSALCACVNNPQNEENQKLCSSAFPQASQWVEESLQHDVARPICSLIGLTVANSKFAQDYFASIGGLDILAKVLSHLVNGIQLKTVDSRLAIMVTKTLDACIAENAKSVHHLSKHNIISSLVSLLSHATLEAEDKFSIVLTVGHLTEDCETNQYELLKSNGLPLMIQVLAESQDDELHKAATFVLQNCRYITETLSLSLKEHVPNVNPCPAASHNNQRDTFMDDYWAKAEEIFHKIQNLQQQYNENINNIEEPKKRENVASKHVKAVVASMPQRPAFVNHPNYVGDHSTTPGFHGEEKVRQRIYLETAKLQKSTESTSVRLSKTCNDSYIVQETHADLQIRDQRSGSDSSRNNITSRDAVTQTLPHHETENLHNDSPLPHRELSGEAAQTSPQACSVRNLRLNGAKQSTSARQEKSLDPMVICADIINKEISSILDTRQPLQCSGCLVTGHVMNSRNCTKILMGCPNLCDRHKVILQAEEHYRTEYSKLLYGTRAAAHKNILLTPLKRGKVNVQNEARFNRAVNRKLLEYSDEHIKTPRNPDQSQFHKGTRKDFTEREIAHLLDGVEKFGHHWNAILWSYPFQKGRRNVDLAKKYKQLQGQQ
ncbi:telomere repeats-binding bouquet formation protein 1 [Leptodactylus fuscus]|uniref:telomere repeats-binding bouquet formation protein 1 n=1 Tax=Leptodactylus fuscus TaxID=238119 RepID=UPI003F4E5C20